ncbi:MAG: sulfotransferase, partial [Proteobacteria bacterium]|nr:sulfotransferase [Pseudomonadota bacterium]
LKLNPNDAEVHRLLSGVKKYNRSDVQIVQMEELYEYGGINNEQRCQLCFALHKVYEDLKDLSRSFKYLMEGNALRKEILGYDIQKDKKLFTTLKIGNEKFCAKSLKYDLKPNMPIPIFILGMPRSGTTLVEQIVSSHSKVYGAGELGHVGGFGSSMALGEPKPTKRSLINFRDLYLGELKRLSNESFFVTDKMPLNFRYIGLIRAALPEAKIIHVERNAAATCFSNFKIYFSQNGLGYSNNLDDLVKYYQMYKDLMQFWRDQFPGLIYDLNYDTLVSDQEKEIRGLIQHIGIAWEDVCLSPQKNKRSVRTASQDQIRKKIYKGSSHEWQKFKQFTGGALDVLEH